MKAQIYAFTISDMGWQAKTITEVYIPKINTCFNVSSGKWHCFEPKADRYAIAKKVSTIDVPTRLVKILKKYTKASNELADMENWFKGKILKVK